MNLEEYLKHIINDSSLYKALPEVLNSFEKKSIRKNELFVASGTICEHFCYIESGILQHSIQVGLEEKTTYLALKNSCTVALKSFLNQTVSRKNVKALTDCSLWVISVDKFKYLLENNAAFFMFYHKLIENQIFRIDDYRIDLLTLSPEERYQKLLKNDPQLLQSIPLHYLASFLGISTRHMSRIRKNVK
jgi:CRP-like cAMP-binding protein